MPPKTQSNKKLVQQVQTLTSRFAAMQRSQPRRQAPKNRGAARNRGQEPRRGGNTRVPRGLANPPVSYSSKTQGAYHSIVSASDVVTRVRGRSFLGVVSSASSVPGGYDVGLLASLHPAAFGDRFSILASTFDKYVYNSMKLVYVPACATATAGLVTMVLERDAMDPLVDLGGASPLSQITSYEKATPSSVYMPASVSYGRDPTERRTYFMDQAVGTGDSREWEQGRAIAYLSNVAASTTYGMIYLDYDVELVAPSISPTAQRTIIGGAAQYTRVSTAFTNPTASQSGFVITGIPAAVAEAGRIVEMIFTNGTLGGDVSTSTNFLSFGGNSAQINPGNPVFAAAATTGGLSAGAGLFPSLANLLDGGVTSNGFSASATLAKFPIAWVRAIGGIGSDFLLKGAGEL